MKKTNLYLDESDLARLRLRANREGRCKAEIVRAAIAAYESRLAVSRSCALAGSWKGDGTSVADVDEDEILRGFGMSIDLLYKPLV